MSERTHIDQAEMEASSVERIEETRQAIAEVRRQYDEVRKKNYSGEQWQVEVLPFIRKEEALENQLLSEIQAYYDSEARESGKLVRGSYDVFVSFVDRDGEKCERVIGQIHIYGNRPASSAEAKAEARGYIQLVGLHNSSLDTSLARVGRVDYKIQKTSDGKTEEFLHGVTWLNSSGHVVRPKM